MTTPEQPARQTIDNLLTAAGWHVQDRAALNLSASRGVAVRVSRDIRQCQFVVLLVDYNPNSTLLNMPALEALPFASQIRLMRTGFAMWQQNVLPLTGTTAV